MRSLFHNPMRLLGGLGVLLLLVVVYCVAFPTILWSGSTQLTVEFLVTDVDTGEPIRGAELDAYGWENYQEVRWQERTDASGIAPRTTRVNCGEDGLFVNTFSVQVPDWRVTVSAPGYERSGELKVQQPHYCWAAKRIAPGQSKVVIPVALRKSS